MITKCIDAMQQKIDQEQNIEVVQSNSQEPVYYASVAYFQMGEDTDRLDKLQEKGDYEALLKEAIEYDASDAIDLSNTYLSPTKYRGDDLLVENEHYAVVYNPSVGGTYDVMRKVTAEEVRQNITRYGLPDNATADVKSIAENRNRKWKLSHKKRLTFIEEDNGIFSYLSLSYFQKSTCIRLRYSKF